LLQFPPPINQHHQRVFELESKHSISNHSTKTASANCKKEAMPLVIPGLSEVASSSSDAKSEWQQKLVGKKLSDSSTDSNVCPAQRSFSLVFSFPFSFLHGN
jgi:hypothetical protein